MGLLDLFLFLLIGLAAGWLAGRIMKTGQFGLVGDLVVGVVGAIIGGWLFSLIGLKAAGIVGSLVIALVGAIVLLYIIRLIKKV